MDTYITRVCWNETGWERPPGSAREADESFTAQHGFGFEEWLFSPEFEIDGWRYGFLQGVNNSQARLADQDIAVLIWAKSDNARYLVGGIRQCRVLTSQAADAAHTELEKRGVIDQMMADVRAIGGKAEFITDKPRVHAWTLDIINIRFRIEDAYRFEPMVTAPRDNWICTYHRYGLVNAEITPTVMDTWRRDTRSAISVRLPQLAPKASDLAEPPVERRLTTTYRILRDTVVSSRVKRLHQYRCQLCGHSIRLSDGTYYAEAHHIRPLGSPHNGPDCLGNVLCLCPNHHAELDYCVISIDPSALRTVRGHVVDRVNVEYHNREIHRPIAPPCLLSASVDTHAK